MRKLRVSQNFLQNLQKASSLGGIIQFNHVLCAHLRIEEIGEKIKAAFEGVDVNDNAQVFYAAKILQECYGEIQTRWDKAIAAATRNYNAQKIVERATGVKENAAGEGDVQLMAWDAEETFDSACDDMETISDSDYLKDRSAHPFVFAMDHTPKKLLENVEGIKDRSFLIRRDALYLAVRESGAQEGNYHNLGAETVKQIPASLENPDAIIKTDSPNRFTVLTHINISTGQALISVEIESMKDYEGKNDYYNIIVTMLDYRERYLKQLFKNHSATVKYENEALEQVNPQLYGWLRTINSKTSDNSIRQESENSNPQNEQLQQWDNNAEDTAAEAKGRELAYARLQAENAALHDAVEGLKKIAGRYENTVERLQRSLSLTRAPGVRIEDAQKLARQLLKENCCINVFRRKTFAMKEKTGKTS